MMGILRAAAPRRFNELEKHLGCRVSEVDDDTFLSCVQWLLESNRDEMSLSKLRAELSGAGYQWALEATPAALLKVVQNGRAERTPEAPAAPAERPAPRTVPTSVDADAVAEEVASLDDLFSEAHADCPSNEEAPAAEPKERKKPSRPKKKEGKSSASTPEQDVLDISAAGLLGEMLAAEEQSEPTEEKKAPAEEQAEATEDKSTGDDKPAADEPTPEVEPSAEDLSAVFGDEEEFAGDAMFSDAEPEPVDFTDDFLDGPAPEDAVEDFSDFGDLDDDFLATPKASESEVQEEPSEDTAAVEPTEEPAEEPAEESAPSEAAAQPAPETRRVVRSAADKFTPFAGIPAAGKGKSATTPIRPKRRSSVSATAPATPQEASSEDALKLTALALMPRPTFVADLISVLGSAARVEAWVESERLKQREG